MTKFVAAFIFSTFLSGCVSLNSVSLTQIPKKRKEMVSAESSRMIFLGFNFDNDYADQVTKKLMRKCPNGQIKGILTKDETKMYFLFFVYERVVSARGYCIKS